MKYQTAGNAITVPRRLTIRMYSEWVSVWVFHSILHHHEENVGTLSDFLCEISHTANRLRLTGPREREALRQASF